MHIVVRFRFRVSNGNYNGISSYRVFNENTQTATFPTLSITPEQFIA